MIEKSTNQTFFIKKKIYYQNGSDTDHFQVSFSFQD
jgi:hypothetical protein